MITGFFARLTGQPLPAPEVATEEAEDPGSLLVFTPTGDIDWENSRLTDEEITKVARGSRNIFTLKSRREQLEDKGYHGIPIKKHKRSHHSAFAGSKVAMEANAGDMAPEFKQFREEHIQNDPLAIGYFGSIFVPFEDAVIAGSGHNIAGEPQSMDQIILSTGSVAATALGAAGSLDVPGTGMLDEAGEATDAGRTVARVEDEVANALGTVDAMEDARRMSGRGRLGGLIAKGSSLDSLMNEAKSLKIPVEFNDALLDKLPDGGKAAAFDYSSGKIIIRSDATELEIFHELQHAKQWVALGRDPKAYTAVDVFAREFHVYRQIMDNKSRWSPRELSEATRQITEYFRDYLKRMGSGN